MIAWFVRHRTAANLLMIGILLIGLLGATSLTRRTYPVFTPDKASVRVIWTGASAAEVEESVCELIEEAIEGVAGVEEVESVAQENVGTVTITVADGYDPAIVAGDVRNEVDQLTGLPDDADEPVTRVHDQRDRVIIVSLVADRDVRTTDLVAVAEAVRRDLLALPAVGLVERRGAGDRELRIGLSRDALEALGLTVEDVARQIEARSLDLPTGSVETDEREIRLRLVEQRRTVEEFLEVTVLTTPAGAEIPLRAVADARDTFEDEWDLTTLARDFSAPDGTSPKRSIDLAITSTTRDDAIRIAAAVREFAAAYPPLPHGVKMVVRDDWSVPVRQRLEMLVVNGVQGFVLVFLVLFLFLDVRLAFWVAVGIPVSFLGALYLMDVGNQSLNMISMFSLILALGIVVDDAIVVSENVYTRRRHGLAAPDAAESGLRQVAPGVIAAMLTTVGVFMPLMMMVGEIGKVLRVLPYGVIAALAVSLLDAFIILPNHLGHSLRHMPAKPARLRRWVEAAVRFVIDRLYVPPLRAMLRVPTVPVAVALALFFVCAGLIAGGRVKFTPFPDIDGDFVVARVEMPAGTDVDRTRAVLDRLQDALVMVNREFTPRQPDGQELIRLAAGQIGTNTDVGDRGSHLATLTVELLPADVRTVTCDEVLEAWRKAIGDVPDLVSLTLDQARITPGGKPVALQFRGHNLPELDAAAAEAQEVLARYPGVRNLQDNLRPDKPEIRVRMRDVARSAGLTPADLARQLQAAFSGIRVQQFQRDGETVDVLVRFGNADRATIGDLDDFRVRTPAGHNLPFHLAAEAVPTRGYATITRVDGVRAVTITADVASGFNAFEVMRPVLEHVQSDEFAARHPGVTIALEGQQKETVKTADSVVRGFIIGLAIVYGVLALVFRSWVQPLIVMIAIPLGLIGAVIGHLLMGYDWTMPSAVGFVSLSGIVVNDSIVLIEFIRLRRAEGHGTIESIVEAGRSRFRAVFLTSATTIAGLLPLLTERSMQAQVVIPMAISVAFGLLFATFLTLAVVPSLYAIWSRISERFGWAEVEPEETTPSTSPATD